MKRSSIIKGLMRDIQEDDIVVASTGYISREVFKYDRDLNFYMMGSMGNALAIGIGLALHLDNRIFVINGDGACLMSLGTMLTAKKLNLTNLTHIILDNNIHESTGGQKTVSDQIDFNILCKHTIVYKTKPDKSEPPRIHLSPIQITERFKRAIQSSGYKRI